MSLYDDIGSRSKQTIEHNLVAMLAEHVICLNNFYVIIQQSMLAYVQWYHAISNQINTKSESMLEHI